MEGMSGTQSRHPVPWCMLLLVNGVSVPVAGLLLICDDAIIGNDIISGGTLDYVIKMLSSQ